MAATPQSGKRASPSARRPVRGGFTLIEILAALTLGSFLAVGIAAMINSSLKDIRSQQTAAYQAQVTEAAAKYLRDNYNDLATRGDPNVTLAVPLTELKSAGAFLSPSFGLTNPYKQTPCLLVRRIAPAAPATSPMLSALLVTEGGIPIEPAELSYIAASAGRNAGAIKNVDGVMVAEGSYGSWRLSGAELNNYTGIRCADVAGAGHLASALFYDNPSQLGTDYLYRTAVPGRPELNEMSTPIGMTGAALIDTNANPNCGPGAKIAIDTTRNLISCGDDQLWKGSSWKASVPNFAELANTPGKLGDVRLERTNGRAYAYAQTLPNGVHVWTPLAVDDAGNLDVPNTISAATANITNVTVGNDLTVNNQVDVVGVINARGVFAEDFIFAPAYQFHLALPVGTPCNYEDAVALPDGSFPIVFPTGTLATDANGLGLICQSPDNVFKYENGQATP